MAKHNLSRSSGKPTPKGMRKTDHQGANKPTKSAQKVRVKPGKPASVTSAKGKSQPTKAAVKQPVKRESAATAKTVVLPARGRKIAAPPAPSSLRPKKVGTPVRMAKPITPAKVPIPSAEETSRRVKSPLSTKELKEFKALLLSKRAEIVGDASRLAENMNHRSGAGADDHSSMPIHMADLGSDNWEQELNLGLLASEQETVREIDNALSRIQDGTFGICIATQNPIGLARLRAKPWARYCIEYARAREEGRA